MASRRIAAQLAATRIHNRSGFTQENSLRLTQVGMKCEGSIGGDIQVTGQPPSVQCIQVDQSSKSPLLSELSAAKRTGNALCALRLTTKPPLAGTLSAAFTANAPVIDSTTAGLRQ